MTWRSRSAAAFVASTALVACTDAFSVRLALPARRARPQRHHGRVGARSTLVASATAVSSGSSSSSSSSVAAAAPGPQSPTTPPSEAYLYGQLSPDSCESFSPGLGVFSQKDWLEAWQSVDAPMNAQGDIDYEIDEVEGEVPPSLLGGSLFRLGPGKFERGGVRYQHVLDGDGFMLKIDLNKGGSKHRVTGKFVETHWFKDEDEDDLIKYRNTFGTQVCGGVVDATDCQPTTNIATTATTATTTATTTTAATKGARLDEQHDEPRAQELGQHERMLLGWQAARPLGGRRATRARPRHARDQGGV